MENISNIINKRAKQLVVEGKRTELDLIQDEIERFYKDNVKATKIYPDGNLLLEVGSAPLASDVYMNQVKILKSVGSALPGVVKGLRTKII